MNAKRATETLSKLVQGIDPVGGGEVPSDSVLQRAEVLRALLVAIGAMEEKTARDARRATLPANVGAPWSADEERALVTAFQGGDALSAIAENLRRTVRAVEARLERLGLLRPDQRTTRDILRS